MLGDAPGLPHPDGFEVARIGGFGGFATYHTVGFSAVVELELEFRGRKIVELGRAGLECLEQGAFASNGTEFRVLEIVDIESESEVASFETKDVLEIFTFAFSPAVLPEGVGVILVEDRRDGRGLLLIWLIRVLCGERDGGEEGEDRQSEREFNIHGKG